MNFSSQMANYIYNLLVKNLGPIKPGTRITLLVNPHILLTCQVYDLANHASLEWEKLSFDRLVLEITVESDEDEHIDSRHVIEEVEDKNEHAFEESEDMQVEQTVSGLPADKIVNQEFLMKEQQLNKVADIAGQANAGIDNTKEYETLMHPALQDNYSFHSSLTPSVSTDDADKSTTLPKAKDSIGCARNKRKADILTSSQIKVENEDGNFIEGNPSKRPKLDQDHNRYLLHTTRLHKVASSEMLVRFNKRRAYHENRYIPREKYDETQAKVKSKKNLEGIIKRDKDSLDRHKQEYRELLRKSKSNAPSSSLKLATSNQTSVYGTNYRKYSRNGKKEKKLSFTHEELELPNNVNLENIEIQKMMIKNFNEASKKAMILKNFDLDKASAKQNLKWLNEDSYPLPASCSLKTRKVSKKAAFCRICNKTCKIVQHQSIVEPCNSTFKSVRDMKPHEAMSHPNFYCQEKDCGEAANSQNDHYHSSHKLKTRKIPDCCFITNTKTINGENLTLLSLEITDLEVGRNEILRAQEELFDSKHFGDWRFVYCNLDEQQSTNFIDYDCNNSRKQGLSAMERKKLKEQNMQKLKSNPVINNFFNPNVSNSTFIQAVRTISKFLNGASQTFVKTFGEALPSLFYFIQNRYINYSYLYIVFKSEENVKSAIEAIGRGLISNRDLHLSCKGNHREVNQKSILVTINEKQFRRYLQTIHMVFQNIKTTVIWYLRDDDVVPVAKIWYRKAFPEHADIFTERDFHNTAKSAIKEFSFLFSKFLVNGQYIDPRIDRKHILHMLNKQSIKHGILISPAMQQAVSMILQRLEAFEEEEKGYQNKALINYLEKASQNLEEILKQFPSMLSHLIRFELVKLEKQQQIRDELKFMSLMLDSSEIICNIEKELKSLERELTKDLTNNK